jgi:UDP-N-acetylmuramate dehydrogenase
MEFVPDVALAPYTTLRIGGPARWFAEAAAEDDIAAGVIFARDRGLPLFVLGGGSNLLVSDQGFPGLVLRIALRGMTHADETGVFSVAAGETWDGFVSQAVASGWAGIECLSGIPGTVGGTPVQNVGAYGQEVSQTIAAVRAFDRQTCQFVTLTNSECGFAYRRSIFNSVQPDRYIVSGVDYSLVRNGAPSLAYEDLKRYFKPSSGDRAADSPPTLAAVRDAVLAIRERKGMLIVAGQADSLSAGSFFKNPIVPLTALARVADALATEEDRIPRYPATAGAVKLPAAWLLEQAGFHKGYVLGNAGISSRHTLALINRGSASAADLIALRDRIMQTVTDRFGIHLEPEPVWIS